MEPAAVPLGTKRSADRAPCQAAGVPVLFTIGMS
jgi:hypothetical protein